MSLALLLPAGLAALAALLLPLLIHLARRSEQRPTAFAALRWLRQKPKPRHRIRFDEWLLLLLRLLLLVLLALLLARPVLWGGDAGGAYVAVVPGVDVAQARAAFGTAKARWHWLSPGFPEVSDAAAPSSVASASSLLRELDANLPADVPLTVFVPARLDGMDGAHIALSRRVDWRVLPGAMPQKASPAAASAFAPSVRYAAAREPALRYLRAAHIALQPSSGGTSPLDAALAGQALPRDARHMVWLVPGPVPDDVRAWIRQGGVALLDVQAKLDDMPRITVPLWRDEVGAVLVDGSTYGRGRVMRLRRALEPAAMPQLLDADFPNRLRSLFMPAMPQPARVSASEHAPVTGGPSFTPSPRDLQPWLAMLIALVFVGERVVATSRRRGSAP